jgi:DNA integrity scanning protein DisA with diadenylate cyclase activity
MAFKIVKERSNIKSSSDSDFNKEHREISDAFEAAVNYLAQKPSGTKVTITETIELKRSE